MEIRQRKKKREIRKRRKKSLGASADPVTSTWKTAETWGLVPECHLCSKHLSSPLPVSFVSLFVLFCFVLHIIDIPYMSLKCIT